MITVSTEGNYKINPDDVITIIMGAKMRLWHSLEFVTGARNQCG